MCQVHSSVAGPSILLHCDRPQSVAVHFPWTQHMHYVTNKCYNHNETAFLFQRISAVRCPAIQCTLHCKQFLRTVDRIFSPYSVILLHTIFHLLSQLLHPWRYYNNKMRDTKTEFTFWNAISRKRNPRLKYVNKNTGCQARKQVQPNNSLNSKTCHNQQLMKW